MTDNIEVEVGADDSSLYSSGGDSFGTDTTSLTSSVYNFVYENGRRYTSQRSRGSDGEYLLPNDEKEQERLDLVHHFYLLIYKGELFLAPLEKSKLKRALDLGCGTGIWAIDFADEHPECEVLGTDLSPIQPGYVPPNCKFEIDDFEQEWVYKDKFDYIHGRSIMGSVRDWDTLIERCFENLAPGGWVEFCEGDFVNAYSEDGSTNGTAVEAYHKAMAEAGKKSYEMGGAPFDVNKEIQGKLLKAGFTNIKVDKFKGPFGPWPKDAHYKAIGQVGWHVGMSGFEAYGMAAFTRILGWERERAKKLIDDCLAAVGRRNVHLIYTQWNYIAQKPLDSKC